MWVLGFLFLVLCFYAGWKLGNSLMGGGIGVSILILLCIGTFFQEDLGGHVLNNRQCAMIWLGIIIIPLAIRLIINATKE